jgi:hypothetical protein
LFRSADETSIPAPSMFCGFDLEQTGSHDENERAHIQSKPGFSCAIFISAGAIN